MIDTRLRAVLDLSVASAREEAGRHEYDGTIQDLSPRGVQDALARLGGPPLSDSHDDAHLAAFENGLQVSLGELEVHRFNPMLHLQNLEVACYDREYAPEPERIAALRRHLALWPDAVDMAVTSLTGVSQPVARSLVSATAGLTAGLPPNLPEVPVALAAHERLLTHVRKAASSGDPDASLGAQQLARLMGASDAINVDLGQLSVQADLETHRLQRLLSESCRRIDPDSRVADVVHGLVADHPDSDGVMAEARDLTEEVIEFCRDRGLLTHLDGTCIVGVPPESRRWATAMVAWAAPGEPDAPTRYDITPPDAAWPEPEQDEWLSMFNRAAMMAITVHEVAPGHYAHGRALRHAATDVKRTLMSAAFAEGWAHYAEEMMLDEGFRENDPRFAAGVALEALVRVTRLACAIGLHTGSMDVQEATHRFQADAFLAGAVARSEAQRGTFDPTYGMYTWGKWEIVKVRAAAEAAWGSSFTVRRFHDAMLRLGSPPLGLLGAAVSLD